MSEWKLTWQYINEIKEYTPTRILDITKPMGGSNVQCLDYYTDREEAQKVVDKLNKEGLKC